MAVFIETRTDPFVQRRQAMRDSLRESGRNQTPVRRPLRGLEIKEDTYSVIRVVTADGRFLPILDAAGEIVTSRDGKSYTTSYSNFLVQNVVEERHEKQQIVETFGDSYIFFFGESPRVLQVNGLLLNTADFNWRAEWWENYERYFRGTRLVERNARLYMIFDDVIVEGYMLQCQANDNAQAPHVIQMTFQLFVTGYTNISMIANPNYPRPDGDIDYTQLSAYGEAMRQYESGRNLQTESYSDAVRRANQQSYMGSGALLASAIRNALNFGDSSIYGFLQRAGQAIYGMQRIRDGMTSIGQRGTGTGTAMGFKASPFGLGGDRGRDQPLRSTFRDNEDEFLGQANPSSQDLASPLSMAERWLQMDRAVDNSILNYINPTDPRFWDIMGRVGRAEREIRQRGGMRRAADGIFQTGVMRHLAPGVVRDIPFGLGSFGG